MPNKLEFGDKNFGCVRLTRGLTREVTCVTMSETTPEDHLIILCEFLAGNKAHATSSSIRVRVNCRKVRVCKLLVSECTVTSELYRRYTIIVWTIISTCKASY